MGTEEHSAIRGSGENLWRIQKPEGERDKRQWEENGGYPFIRRNENQLYLTDF